MQAARNLPLFMCHRPQRGGVAAEAGAQVFHQPRGQLRSELGELLQLQTERYQRQEALQQSRVDPVGEAVCIVDLAALGERQRHFQTE